MGTARVTEVVLNPVVDGARRLALLHLLFSPSGVVPADVAKDAERELAAAKDRRENPPPPRRRTALDVTCPECEAAPDEWCATSSGRSATNLHSRRFRAAGLPS